MLTSSQSLRKMTEQTVETTVGSHFYPYTMGRTGLWQLLRKYECPEKFTRMVEALHTGMMAKVNDAGETSDTFRPK